MTTDPQTPVSPSNRRALVHNAITDALSKAGDWVPLSVRIAATRAALAEVDAWHTDEPAPAGLGVSATPSHTDQAFVLWLDASDGSVPTHDGIVWPDGTSTIHHRHFGHTTTHASAEAARQAAHGKQGRIVWPKPADRAAVYREAADAVAALREETFTNVAVYPVYDGSQRLALSNAEGRLRRLADEAQQQEPTETEAHPPYHRWYTETRDGLAEEWAPGMRFTDWAEALARFETVSRNHPLWKDGTPVRRRFVRETTSYTVEQTDAASRPEPSVHGESVAHLAGDHDDEPNTGPGWYEVINPRNATTNIVYVHEDGSLYMPEGDDLTPEEFAFAAARGNAHRLVRADDLPAVDARQDGAQR